MKKVPILKINVALLIIVPTLYVGGCSLKTARLQNRYDMISVGDSIDRVEKIFGPADVKETGQKPFLRYSSNACLDACSIRLWYENRMTLDIEAWSFDIDRNGRVIGKYNWVSP